MNFLFVDRILSLDPGHSAVGIKHISDHDYYLVNQKRQPPHFMPCLIGEALGQCANWVAMKASEFKQRAVAGLIGEAALLGQACVGDTLVLEVTIENTTSEAVYYRGEASVDGHVIFTAKDIVAPFLPMERLSHPDDVQRQFERIYRPGPLPVANKISSASSVALFTPLPHRVRFDRVLALNPGVSAKAVKNVTFNAPYFQDHFANQPVLPLTLLLQCKLDLAQQMLGPLFKPHRLTRVKISGFIKPGDQVFSEIYKVDEKNDCVNLAFRSEVDGKRVCMGRAQFIAKETLE